MNSFLTLARDYIERMSNPAYGLVVNEDYSQRFGSLLNSENFKGLMMHEVRQLQEVDELTPHGWSWLLAWATSNNIGLNNDLLFHLFLDSTNVFMKSMVILAATSDLERRGEYKQKYEHHQTSADVFLSRIVDYATGERWTSNEEFIPGKFNLAEVTLVALLQADTNASLKAAGALLRRDWQGHSALANYFETLTNNLDAETRQVWINTLYRPDNEAREP